MRQLGVSGSPEKEVPAAAAAAPEEEKKRVRSYDVEESTTDCSDQEEEEEGDDDKGYSEEMEYGTADEQREPNVWESESVKEEKEEEEERTWSGMKLRDVTMRRRKKMKTWKSE